MVIQRQLGHPNRGITSQGIDSAGHWLTITPSETHTAAPGGRGLAIIRRRVNVTVRPLTLATLESVR